MVSDEKRTLIRKRLCEGISNKEIASEAGVSVDTVRRIKKEMPASVLTTHDTGDNSIIYDNTTYLTKKESEYTKKLKSALALYEDAEEGWCYHLVKDDYRLKTSGTWWAFIAYPESVPAGWIKKLQASGLRIAISPLHDKDKWDHDSPEMVNAETGEIIAKGARYKAGDAKKAHWHGIAVSDKRISAIEANAIIRSCTKGPYVQKCRSLHLAYRYFTHEDHPEKYQGYEKDEIIKVNDFHLEPNKYEVGKLQADIIRDIKDHNLDEWWKVMEFFINSPEMMVIICSKPGAITSYVRSLWKKNHPEGTVQRIRIVDIEESGE